VKQRNKEELKKATNKASRRNRKNERKKNQRDILKLVHM
jgi:hypothetical protein